MGSVGDQPSWPVARYVPCTRFSTDARVVSFRPAATIATTVTSATPTVSAPAVDSVRPGLRIALRRASTPAAPPTFSAGRPSSETTGRIARPARPTLREPASPSRSAATGVIRVARHAGLRPASTVPTRSDTTTVEVANTVPASGRSRPSDVNSDFRAPASR